jgi:C-terminal processing protease CtpA/Prc
MQKKLLFSIVWIVLLSLLSGLVVFAIGEDDGDDTPAPISGTAIIENDEGGAVLLTGSVTYTNPLFTGGVAEPVIILEDQTGFVDRNEHYIIPRESQVLGQITSDFFESPFNYSLSLPQVPNGTLRDVDNDDEDDTGVMVFAVAYWTNKFGDPFLEERDLYGGGWSTAYASTRASESVETRLEIVGGKFVIHAPDDEQGFPSGFGADGLLFTDDDPIVTIPQGYSVVDMDAEPFVFDRSAEQIIDLYEPAGSAVNDFSELGYTEAFDAMVELFRKEYAFTEFHDLDWDALHETYRPQFIEAENAEDIQLYGLALRDFLWEIPDGHVSMPLSLISDGFREETDGGLGISLAELDDGRFIVNFLLEGSPVQIEGMELGAEILEWDGRSLEEAMDDEFIWAHEVLGTEHTYRLQQLRYVTRFPLGTEVEITFQNPEGEEPQTVMLEAFNERVSFSRSSFFADTNGLELPVEFEILPSGYGYVAIYSFSDNEYLTVELWERMLQTFIQADVQGIIIDMRYNGGGSGFLADQMAAYFFQEEHILGYGASYNEEIDDFYFDPRGVDKFILPPEDLRYDGELAVVIAPSCFSACEFFSYNMTIEDRAAIVGHYPTGGLGGGVTDFYMPEDTSIRFTVSRQVDPDYNIHIEGQGVAPTIDVPVTLESELGDIDALLSAAEEHLTEAVLGKLIYGGDLVLGSGSTEVLANGIVEPNQRIRYRLTLPANRVVSIYLNGVDETVDTVLTFYDESGTQRLGENDDVDEDTLSSAITDLDVGEEPFTLLVDVTVKDSVISETFTLKVEEVSDLSQDS